MGKAFDKILPIPKTPRVYHPPPPPKPFSWIPSGGRKFGTEEYDRRLKYFAAKILDIDSKRSKTLMKKLGPRSWGYYFEGMNLITKGQIGTVSKAIADCRKRGFLPIDFTAEDPNTTRRFTGFERAADPVALLRELRDQVADFLENMASLTTDFRKGEKYFVMLVTEKGDMIILLGHKCKIYHIPKASSAGWYVVHTRATIAKMAKLAEAMGMTPVLLLFYDLDPGGWKISETFRKGLEDCSGGTGWRPDSLIIERIGLNPDQVKKCGLTWINNLKSSSGKEIGKRDPETGEIHDWDFERVVADEDGNPRRRKCELNAFFRNDETMHAAQEIFRHAVEKYYGAGAKERFKKKEKRSKKKLKGVYDNPVWGNFLAEIDKLTKSLSMEKPKEEERPSKPAAEKEVEVTVNRGYYGRCPKCDRSFDYDDEDIGKLMRCRGCSLPMRLRMASRGKKR